MCDVSGNNLVGIKFSLKIGASICLILFPANYNCELMIKFKSLTFPPNGLTTVFLKQRLRTNFKLMVPCITIQC